MSIKETANLESILSTLSKEEKTFLGFNKPNQLNQKSKSKPKINIEIKYKNLPIPKFLPTKSKNDLILRINRVTPEYIFEIIEEKGFFHFVLFDCKDVYFISKNGRITYEVRY